jgi:DNA-binding XRE family transcriptional regulator
MTFREELKAWRARCDLTQRQAAEALGVKLRSLEHWESASDIALRIPPHLGLLRTRMAQIEEEHKCVQSS